MAKSSSNKSLHAFTCVKIRDEKLYGYETSMKYCRFSSNQDRVSIDYYKPARSVMIAIGKLKPHLAWFAM